MERVTGIIEAVASTASLDNVIGAGKAIAGPVGSYMSLEKNMKDLKRKHDRLSSREKDVINQLGDEEGSGGKRGRKEVGNWLARVDKAKKKVESLDEAVSQSRRVSRFNLAGRVGKLTKQVEELLEQGEFPQGLTLNTPHTAGQDMLTEKLVGRAFKENLGKVMGYLEDPKVLSIGVWGMGGVGKTTLVKHVNNQARQKSLFDDVCWMTVSNDMDIHKLQGLFARAINLDLKDEQDEEIRATKLSAMLKKRRRLFILDDVWDGFDWGKVGNPVEANGCKLIITTRKVDVCRRLGCRREIKVEPLSEKDAWDLFKENLRYPPEAPCALPPPQVLGVAEHVAKECAGLPLGIITVARSMRGVNDDRQWRDALGELQESKEDAVGEMDDKVFQVLRFSYNRLNNPKAQDIFLHCALYPEDHKIEKEELIQRLIDQGVIKRMKNRQAQFYKGHTLLNKLVNSCLLEAVAPPPCRGDHKERVKMHDLLRDMAIQMRNPQFMVKAGVQLRKLPDEQDWSEDVEKVSLMNNRMKEVAVAAAAGMWSRLTTLLLSGNESLERIEDSFFQHTPALQILDLTGCKKIQRLPDSVSNLKNLTALLLHGCSKLQGIPSLAELTSLKRLDLGSTGIREVPEGLEWLVNLTYLDLSYKLEVFPPGILPQLLQLEVLKFLFGAKAPAIKGEELEKLTRLSTFTGKLKFDGFKSYVMSRETPVSRGPNWFYKFSFLSHCGRVTEEYRQAAKVNCVKVERFRIRKIVPATRKGAARANADVEALEALLQNQDVQTAQSLELYNCSGAQNLCDVSWLDNATQNLKRCRLWNVDGMQCLVPCSRSSPYFLQKLEKLELWIQRNLEVLFELGGDYRGETAIPSSTTQRPQPVAAAGRVFSCLKVLSLMVCPKIEKLFHPGFLPNLENLQEIWVEDCEALQEIISKGETITSVEYALPNLKTLSLRKLPKLTSICANTICCPSLCEIIVTHCPNLKRMPFSEPPSEFQSISVDPMEWWESAEWDHPDAKDRLLPFRKDFVEEDYFRRIYDYEKVQKDQNE